MEEQPKILIVEDEEVVSSLFKKILEPVNARINLAETSDEARRFLTNEKVDLVILDERLKDGSSGAQVAGFIREKLWPRTNPQRPVFVTVSGAGASFPGQTEQYEKTAFFYAVRNAGAKHWVENILSKGPGGIGPSSSASKGCALHIPDRPLSTGYAFFGMKRDPA